MGRASGGWKRRVATRLGLRVESLDHGTWLLQRDVEGHRPYRVRRIGDDDARTHLVYHPRSVRRRTQHLQRQLGELMLEQQTMAVVRELGIDCVLDVGANRGQFATGLRRAGYRGRLVSFEPVAEFARRLRRKSADDPAWQVHQFALGEEEGSAEIHTTPGRALSSLLDASEFGKEWSAGLQETVSETIEVKRLDSVFDQVLDGLRDPRVMLKLDTQGFDLPALRGAGERLAEVCALQSEVACLPLYDGMPLMEEQLGVYRREGFDIVGMYPVGRDVETLRVVEFDVLMVRPEAFGS